MEILRVLEIKKKLYFVLVWILVVYGILNSSEIFLKKFFLLRLVRILFFFLDMILVFFLIIMNILLVGCFKNVVKIDVLIVD